MSTPLARSNLEAHLYMDLHPCGCGGKDATRPSELFQQGTESFCRYRCRCGSCGRERTVVFRQPARPSLPSDGEWAVGSAPSELLDAGEWLLVADLEATDDADAEQDMQAACAALNEVLKFLPPGADEVPPSAVWTDRGRALREQDPQRFTRSQLEGLRDVYARMLQQSGVLPAVPIRARTLTEAHQFADLAYCVCGAMQLPPDLPARAPDPDGSARVEFRCPRCGRTRRFDFVLDRLPVPGTETDFGPGRSELIDPGQWVIAVAESQVAAVTELVDEVGDLKSLPERLIGPVLRSLVLAAAAGDQALRFLPPDADQIAEQWFHTDQGRYALRGAPELFRRGPLTSSVVGYRRRLAEAIGAFEKAHALTPERLDELVGAPLPFGARPSAPQPARTMAEATLATIWSVCRCGVLQTLPFEFVVEIDGQRVTVLHDTCDNCGRRREARFVNAADDTAELPTVDALAVDERRSRLFDAGMFVTTARAYTAFAEESLAADSLLDSWYRIRHQLLRAAQSIDEAATFLPEQSDEIPAEAMWTAPGRELYEQEPGLFRRDALARLSREAWQRYQDFPAAHPKPEVHAYLSARSPAERELYLALHPCSCGATQVGEGLPDILNATGEEPVFRYEGRCVGCGRERRFDFVGTDDPMPELDHWAAGERPSELIDAGEWLVVSDGYAADLDTATAAQGITTPATARLFDAVGFDPAETATRGAVRSAAAVDEALKFLPPDRDELPEDAVWHDTGLAVRASFPERFTRTWLLAERERRWNRVAELTGPTH